MQTILVELKTKNAFQALQHLEVQKIIRIVENKLPNAYTLEGKPMSEQDFKAWIEYTENSQKVSLIDAKKQWKPQMKEIKRIEQKSSSHPTV